MSVEGRARLAPLMPHLLRLGADAFFEFAADRTIAAVVDLEGDRNRDVAHNWTN